jgi:hypothetical protein
MFPKAEAGWHGLQQIGSGKGLSRGPRLETPETLIRLMPPVAAGTARQDRQPFNITPEWGFRPLNINHWPRMWLKIMVSRNRPHPIRTIQARKIRPSRF